MSRRESIQDRKKSRNGILLLAAAALLFALLIFVGIKYAANVALFVEKYKKPAPIIQNDKTAPAPPRVDSEVPKITNKETLLISGYSEVGSTVKIYNNGSSVGENLVGDDSRYSVEIKLQKGENQIWATATDTAGNEGGTSPYRVANYDPDAPEIEITEPKDGDTVGEKSLTIKGKTEIGSQITANDRLGTVDQDGNLTIKLTLTEGENIIKLVSTDLAENKTEKDIRVTYEP